MKIKFKTNDTKMKFLYEGPLNNMLESLFSRYESNEAADFYKKMPLMMIEYFSSLGKQYENFMNLVRQNGNNESEACVIPRILPANGHDIFNYVARYAMSDFQIQVVLRFEGKLDESALKKSLRLMLDAEPVFGCRFVESRTPYWRRLSNLDEIEVLSEQVTEKYDESIKDFLSVPLDMDNDLMVKAMLLKGNENDALCLKLNHACCDGAGVREYIEKLSQIYTILISGNGKYKPVPRISGRKDQDKLLNKLGINNLDSVFIPGSDVLSPTWKFPWKQGGDDSTELQEYSLPSGMADRLSKIAKEKGATVNDLILTSLYRAMLKADTPVYGIPLEIPITVDLRRYIPEGKTEAIRNFSGSVNTRLTMVLGESFESTLERVACITKDIKGRQPGLQSAIGLEILEKLDFTETLNYYQVGAKAAEIATHTTRFCGDKCLPTLSNIGFLSKAPIRFGEVQASSASIFPPVVRAPGLLLMTATYEDVLSFTAGYHKAMADGSVVKGLLENMGAELMVL